MKTLILYAHPRMFSIPGQTEPVRNKLIIDKLSKMPNITYRDIYTIYNGNALLTDEQIETEVEVIKGYHRIIIQSPIYWYAMSYLAKTYIDQVFIPANKVLPGKEIGAIFTLGCKSHQAPTPEDLGIPIEYIAKRRNLIYLKPFLLCSDEGEEKINAICDVLTKN